MDVDTRIGIIVFALIIFIALICFVVMMAYKSQSEGFACINFIHNCEKCKNETICHCNLP